MAIRFPLSAVLAVMVCAITPSAAHALSWSTAAPVSSGAGMSPTVSVGEDGSVTVLWQEHDPDHGGVLRVAAATKLPSSESWSAPTYLSPADVGTGDSGAVAAAVVTDRSGTTTAAWTQGSSYPYDILIATREAGQTDWSVASPSDSDTRGGSPALAARPDGSVVAAWLDGVSNGGDYGVASAIRSAGPSPAWSAPTPVVTSSESDVHAIDLAADSTGVVTALMGRSGSSPAILSAQLQAGAASWDAAQTVETFPTLAMQVQDVVAAPNGDVTAAWLADDTPGDGAEPIHAATRDASLGTWSPVTTISGAGRIGSLPELAVTPEGSVLATWSSFNEPDAGVMVSVVGAVRSPAGTWSEQRLLSAPGVMAGYGAPFVDRHGATTLTWFTTADMQVLDVVAVAAPGLEPPPDPATPVAADAKLQKGLPKTAANRYGEMAAVWVDNADERVNVALRDGDRSPDDPPAPTPDPGPAPANDPAQAPATTPTPPPGTAAPLIEARLAGNRITLNASVTLRAGMRCAGKVRATTAFGGRQYRTTAVLQRVDGACRATATIRLRKAPTLRARLRITLSGPAVKQRTLTTRRG